MATTPKLGLTLLEVGQKEKEVTLNTDLTQIDTYVGALPRFLGDATTDPSTTGVPAGSTYYNTATSKLRVLRASLAWANAA
jgi:hypothetical protein